MINLPPQSRTHTVLRGYEHWGATDHLLAGLHDLTVAANWSSKQGTPPRLPRPGAQKRRAAGMTVDEFRRWRATHFEESDDVRG